MTRPETRDENWRKHDVAARRVSRRRLVQGAAAAGLALPAADVSLLGGRSIIPAAGASLLGPRAALAAQDEPLGSTLIGELEGPIVLVDAPRPATLRQASMLDALVEDGT